MAEGSAQLLPNVHSTVGGPTSFWVLFPLGLLERTNPPSPSLVRSELAMLLLLEAGELIKDSEDLPGSVWHGQEEIIGYQSPR